jgi:hypothetical protein
MLRIRIVSTAAAAVIAVALAHGGAAAQPASAGQSGQPLSLLQLVTQTSTTTPAVQKTKIRKVASKRHNKIAAQDSDFPAASAQSAASADAWLAASATPATSVPAAPPADTAPAPQPGNTPADNVASGSGQGAQTGNAPDDGPLPTAVVVGGQTVQVAEADQVNEIDLAADNTPPMESTEPPSDRADVAAMADTMANAIPPRAAFVAPAPADAGQGGNGENASASQNDSVQNSSAVGSASWIAQVLAALGGAIAAGAVAWFLIGAGPVRTYG